MHLRNIEPPSLIRVDDDSMQTDCISKLTEDRNKNFFKGRFTCLSGLLVATIIFFSLSGMQSNIQAEEKEVPIVRISASPKIKFMGSANSSPKVSVEFSILDQFGPAKHCERFEVNIVGQTYPIDPEDTVLQTVDPDELSPVSFSVQKGQLVRFPMQPTTNDAETVVLGAEIYCVLASQYRSLMEISTPVKGGISYIFSATGYDEEGKVTTQSCDGNAVAHIDLMIVPRGSIVK